MKHIVTTLLLFISLHSFGQWPPLEISAGFNQLFIKDDGIKTKLGFGASVKRMWFPDKRFTIVSGLSFEKTKYHVDHIQITESIQNGQKTYYEDMNFSVYTLAIPLMVRINVGTKYRVFLEMGPALEIVPVKHGKGTGVNYSPMNPTYKTKISKTFDHDLTDFGALVGAGFIFPVNSYRFVVSSHYHKSILPIEKRNNEWTEYVTVKIGISL